MVVVVVVTALRVGGETFEARGKFEKRGRSHDEECALVFAFAPTFVDRAKDARVPPAARTPNAETRAGETYIIRDTAREGKNLLLAKWERLLLLLLLLPILLLPWWWSPRHARPCWC